MLVRIWEHWKQSGKTIDEYISWLESQKLTLSPFQRDARHFRVTYQDTQKRANGATRKVLRQRKLTDSELTILDAVYKHFGKHYGWFRRV